MSQHGSVRVYKGETNYLGFGVVMNRANRAITEYTMRTSCQKQKDMSNCWPATA